MTRISIIFALIVALASNAGARILFVDNSLAADCASSYDYATRACGAGTYAAYRTLKGAADVAVAGDTVALRAGTYNEQLAPRNSGTAGAPILYAGVAGEQVIIAGAALAPAIWIYRREYITIQGIIVANVQRWCAVLGSNHIVIRSNAFANANDAGGSSKTGLFFQGSDYNVIRDNVIDNSTQDNLALVQSSHNLVEGNRITRAAHTLWTVKCGSFNVIRGNYFHNQFEKIGEIYDCDNAGYGDFGFDKITSLDDTKHNVVEDNVFAYTATPVDASPYAGIQHAGQHCIIRRNIFHHCLGPAVDLTLYPDEARNTYGNRIYNNVFFANSFGGISVSGVSGAGYTFADNVCRNNVLYRNSFVRYDTRWDWYRTLDGKPVQIITGRTAGVLFERNDVFDTVANELWIVAYGDRTSASNPEPADLARWERDHSAMFVANMQADPRFADTALLDFHPAPGSALINTGSFLAVAASDGNGTTMPVSDPGYFRDGFGIAGLAGDTIQLEGSTSRAVVIAIDYAVKTLTLDRPLQWAAGQRVGLAYNGIAPDIGAFESEAPAGEVPRDIASDELDLYPNPTTGRVTLALPRGVAYTPRIRVVDMYGEQVYSSPRGPAAASGACTIDLANLPPGRYLIIADGENGVMTKTCIRR